jgi:hypothetical protein
MSGLKKTKPKLKSNVSSKKTKYEKCKTSIIGQDMRLFKQGKLKQRNKLPVKSRKQAIAIALSMAEAKCKNKKTRTDVRKENLIIQKKISLNQTQSLRPVDVRNIIAKLKDLKKKNRRREYRTLKIQLLSKLVMTQSISGEIKTILSRFLKNE